jgi:hypothetical protein
MHKEKGMQIMFSSTPNSTQESQAPFIIQITRKYHTLLQHHDLYGPAVLMNDGPLQSKINQTCECS